MTRSMNILSDRYYLFGSRILTHIVFWVVYYIFFSLLWAKDGNYYQSFGLELILMPLRIMASYALMYVLIPNYLLAGKEGRFLGLYLLVITLAGVCQRILVYYYYELLFSQANTALLDPGMIIRAIVLVNSTVLFLSAMKIFQYWKLEHNKETDNEVIEIRAEKRNHRTRISDILYVEGLGNYVTYYLIGDKKLISYNSMKEVNQSLPDQFIRIHKSFIVNKERIDSYNHENVEIGGRILPIGKSMTIAL